jgi:regulatory protein
MPDSVAADDARSVARAIVLRQLSASSKTRSELESALRRRGVPAEAASDVLDRFTELGLVDDSAYAQAWVRSRHDRKGHGPRLLRAQLVRRGVAPDVIEDALAALTRDDDRDAVIRLVRARLPRTEGLDPRVRRQRLLAFVMRRGHDYPVAAEVVDEVLGEAADYPD